MEELNLVFWIVVVILVVVSPFGLGAGRRK